MACIFLQIYLVEILKKFVQEKTKKTNFAYDMSMLNN